MAEGVIEEWYYEKEQSSTYATSGFSEISIDALRQCPVEGMYVETTQDLYDSETGTYPITGINTIVCIASSYSGSRGEDIYEFMESLGINWTCYTGDKHIQVGLPFNNLYYGVNLDYLADCCLYTPDKWGTYGTNYKYTLGATRSVGAGIWSFSLLRGEGWIGWGAFSFTLDAGIVDTIEATIVMIDTSKLNNLLGGFTTQEIPKDDPQKGLPSIPIGAAGDVVKKRLDEISMPPAPVLGATSTGALNVYRVGINDLSNFMSEIFHTTTRTDYTGNDFGELMATALINLDKGMNDLVKGDVTQFVIDTHIIPCAPTTSEYTNIHVGGYNTNSMGRPVTSDFVDVDCGSITIGKGYTTHYDSFQDGSTRLKLYLPFIGYVDIDNNLIWRTQNKPQVIRIRYRFSVLDGSCQAFVSSGLLENNNTSIIGVYSGSCCVHMPLTGANYSSVISGMIQTASGIATGLATGNALTAAQGIGSGIGNMMKPNATMSNDYNATSSYMGIRRPYLIIQKNTQNMPVNFYERNGGLCMIRFKLNDIKGSGFTKCANADVNFAGPDKEEKEEIKALLESCIYL